MSLLGTVILFTCSLLVGIALPRLPLLIIPRFPVMESGMRPYPEPQPLDEHLILQLMMLRRLWRLSFLFALLPLGLGLLVLWQQPSAFGFGLFLGGGWSLLARTIPESSSTLPSGPYSLALIHELHRLRDSDDPCCADREPRWEVEAVRCANCRTVLLAAARPDLGRARRGTGLSGRFRLLLLDGHSLFEADAED
ncbi:MAG: hypothetical protein MK235_02020 [Candidatus Poseidoniales archaeon]|nr:hypothetical protein [Candidatus Poseidoniales archaeon]